MITLLNQDRSRQGLAPLGALGENISLDSSVEHAEAELMKSLGHRKNILGDYTHVGVGVVKKEGYLYITQVFMMKR